MNDFFGRKKPKPFIDQAILELKAIGGRLVVEIGSLRQWVLHELDDTSHFCCYDGHSSMLWARSGVELHTIDVSATNFAITASLISKYPNAHAYLDDGISFLSRFDKKIDLLFLDAWDVDDPRCASNHLAAFEAAKDRLSNNHLVLIDDTDVEFENGRWVWAETGGKGRLLIPSLRTIGYETVFTGRQTLLKKIIG